MVTSGSNGLNRVEIGGTGLQTRKTSGNIGSSDELSNSVAEVAFQWLLPSKGDQQQLPEPIAVKLLHDHQTFFDSIAEPL